MSLFNKNKNTSFVQYWKFPMLAIVSAKIPSYN